MTDEYPFSAIVVCGQFTPDEMREVVALIRRIDDRHPTRRYEIAGIDPRDSAVDAADKVLESLLPPREGRETKIARQITALHVVAAAMKQFAPDLIEELVIRWGEAEEDDPARDAALSDLLWVLTSEHDWVPSTLGHGELMCKRCHTTNREAAALGMLETCDAKERDR